MLRPILNSPGVSWKKLDSVKDCVIQCVNSQILRATHRPGEGGGGRLVNFFDTSKPYLCFGQICTGHLC